MIKNSKCSPNHPRTRTENRPIGTTPGKGVVPIFGHVIQYSVDLKRCSNQTIQMKDGTARFTSLWGKY